MNCCFLRLKKVIHFVLLSSNDIRQIFDFGLPFFQMVVFEQNFFFSYPIVKISLKLLDEQYRSRGRWMIVLYKYLSKCYKRGCYTVSIIQIFNQMKKERWDNFSFYCCLHSKPSVFMINAFKIWRVVGCKKGTVRRIYWSSSLWELVVVN